MGQLVKRLVMSGLTHNLAYYAQSRPELEVLPSDDLALPPRDYFVAVSGVGNRVERYRWLQQSKHRLG